VKIVALPGYCHREWENIELNRHVAMLRRCFGGTYRVVYVGEDRRPELDVFTTAHADGAVGCTISIEPQCVVLVAKHKKSKLSEM